MLTQQPGYPSVPAQLPPPPSHLTPRSFLKREGEREGGRREGEREKGKGWQKESNGAGRGRGEREGGKEVMVERSCQPVEIITMSLHTHVHSLTST